MTSAERSMVKNQFGVKVPKRAPVHLHLDGDICKLEVYPVPGNDRPWIPFGAEAVERGAADAAGKQSYMYVFRRLKKYRRNEKEEAPAPGLFD